MSNRYYLSLFIGIALAINGCGPTRQPSSSDDVLIETAAAPTEVESDHSDKAGAEADTDQQTAQGNVQMPPLETVTFGAGCFWCVESVLLRLKGVDSVTSGYMGGTVPNPTYEAICTGRTGHAEVVQVRFDPDTLPLDKMLDIFWQLHDPTTLNRQGPDTGTQYRSAIFYRSDAQRKAVEASKQKWDNSGKLNGPIVTEIVEASKFYPAEDYHQDFFNKNPTNVYCRINILPKLKKLGLLEESDLSP